MVTGNKKKLRLFSILCAATMWCGLACAVPAPSYAQLQDVTRGPDVEKSHPNEAMERSILASLSSGKVYKQALRDTGALQVFYKNRAYQPYWISGNAANVNAQKFVQVIADSWTHGLNPYDYHYQELSELVNKNGENETKALEILLSDAFVRYAYDMSGMRVQPDLFKLEAQDWKSNYRPDEALGLLGGARNIDDLLTQIEPQGRTYKAMRREYVRLVQQEADNKGPVVQVEFGGLMRPGWNHKAVVDLRKRLGLPIPEKNKYVYDDQLAAEVIKFQKEHHLDADGVIGSNTLRMLNRTDEDKIKQLVANMERLRWAKANTSRRFVIVNIPSYTLWAVEDGQVAIEMPVVVGSPERRTRSFMTEIKGMRFNPTWTVPSTIKRFDIWPKVKEDPAYLSDKGIELYDGYGPGSRTIDPASIDWKSISWKELQGIRMVQIPGDHNALGRFRVLMPNKYDIYLHDTNHKELFVNTERALSSGCMRLSDPQKMAEWVMKGTREWSDSKMQNALDSLRLTDVPVDEPIPVQVTYYTAWLDDKGNVVYGSDIYGYDKKLIEELSKLDAYRIPVHHEGSRSQFVPRAQLISYQK